ncbi:MAG TPA: phosphoribosyltransferase family protein [Rectinemataceae bacterium]|nr:phosphoribosyltransferase family protein [Rectinemataceae bacterium]
MHKEFVPYDMIRDNAIKLAYRIYKDGFVPDIIYVSLRGGAYMGNVISEYFKFISSDRKPVFYAAVVARSYTDVSTHEAIKIDGWTYSPDFLRGGDKVLLVDDVYDSGRTINYLTEVIMKKGLTRDHIKVAVHDYKVREYLPDTQPIHPDYWCRKIEVATPEDETWIHYMSHELVGLSTAEAQKYYIDKDPELAEAMKLVTG